MITTLAIRNIFLSTCGTSAEKTACPKIIKDSKRHQSSLVYHVRLDVHSTFNTMSPNNAMELTASRRIIHLQMTSTRHRAATRALARGSSSYSR